MGHGTFDMELLWMGGMLLLSPLFAKLAKKFNQPKVLGCFLLGLIVSFTFKDTHFMEDVRAGKIELLVKLVEIGFMTLLFKAGMEGNLGSIIRDAKTGWKVALLGVVFPAAGGFALMFWQQDMPWPKALFVGGILSATSVGITAAVLGELKVINEQFGKIIISAAVLDDIIGLIVLTVCKSLNVESPDTDKLMWEIGGALAFVIAIPVLGHIFIGKLAKTMNKLDAESREAIVMGFLFLYGAASMKFGLAPIVGAYFAGVALDELYFGSNHHDKMVERFIDSLITFISPICFAYAVSIVDPKVFFDLNVLGLGLAITAIAMIGKLAAGLGVKEYRLMVGIGMSPRGEVGIIFATIGLQLGAINQEIFGAVMIMVLVTTMATPPLLGWKVRQWKAGLASQEKGELDKQRAA